MKFYKKIFVIFSALILLADVCFPGAALCISVKKEEEMGREFMRVVLEHFELIEDPFIVNYVNKIGNKIILALPPQPFNYRFYIIKEDTYNAFASPAGNIFINSGLFEAMENEEELAGILSHEIAHVVCRHISQRIERQSKIGLITLAGIAAGIFLGIGGAGTASSALTLGSVAAGQSISLAYSREDEIQADQIGLTYLNKAGYSGSGLLTMLKKIRSKQWFGSDQIPTYLTTHPASEDRIVYIGSWLEISEKPSGRVFSIDSYDFQITHTRFVGMHGEKSIVLKKLETRIAECPSDPMALYGYGLVLARTGNLKDAQINLKKALEKRAFDSHILKDLGRIYFFDGRYEEALKTLEASLNIAPDDIECLFFLGRAQAGLGRYGNAENTFEKLIEKDPDYNQALYFLGDAYGRHGRMEDAHYYLGLYYKNEGNFKNAEFHLKRALNTNDPDKKLKIKEILKEISGNR
ncbi:MAG: M48 family metalloprotease [Desulfobacteraceae bacterium]|nr:M48 family metalloprotease [Desulfobacteraceae bacterium]MBC2719672.1 M48 family metalloprotease [Desulfobacteraceae bacterium]